MPAKECPNCRMPAAEGPGAPYCPYCGWNRGAADRQTRFFLRILPILVVVFDAPLIVWILIGHAEIGVLAVLGLVAIVPAVLVVLVVTGRLHIRRLDRNSRTNA